MDFKIMCFAWNASGLRLCETLSQSKADDNRKGFKLTKRAKCVAPDFFLNLRNNIIKENPDLVVITTEDENDKDTYFHAELLKQDMSEHNYSLIKRDVLENVGEVAAGVKYDKLVSGSASGSSLRISIYARNNVVPDLQVADMPSFYGRKDSQAGVICGNSHSGAIGSYLWHKTFGKFVFIAVKLTTGSTFDNYGSNYSERRTAIHNANMGCLLGIVEKLINKPKPIELKPQHIFLLGDFNSNIVIPDMTNERIIESIVAAPNATTFAKLLQYDELTKSMNEFPLKGYSEGVSGAKKGPLFLPTWKLTRGRSDRCEITETNKSINANCFDGSSGIGWHDRILYSDALESEYVTVCEQYNRFDVGNMHQSNQAGVMGIYKLNKHK